MQFYEPFIVDPAPIIQEYPPAEDNPLCAAFSFSLLDGHKYDCAASRARAYAWVCSLV
jgi:hypothetical protein